MITLTVKEAYLAMYRFMETIIRRDNHKGFLDMMSSMSFLRDGSTADSGMWYDWEQAIKRIKGDTADSLSLDEAHVAMCSFLEIYNSRGPSEDITEILARISSRSSNEPGDAGLWEDWLSAVKAAKDNDVDAELRLSR